METKLFVSRETVGLRPQASETLFYQLEVDQGKLTTVVSYEANIPLHYEVSLFAQYVERDRK